MASELRRSPRLILTVGPKAFDHHILPGLVLLELPGEPLFFGVVLSDPLQATLDSAVNISRVKKESRRADSKRLPAHQE
jgi:hypothetical protein